MFTGIIEQTGEIVETRTVPGGRRLTVRAPGWTDDCPPGASVCVSGVCLTVTAHDDDRLAFDVIRETLDRSTLGRKLVGDRVNLERSLRIGDRLDGHFVQGHVDGRASVTAVHASAREHVMWFRPDEPLLPCLVPKGSVAVDGVSLTIAERKPDTFSVALIPTTLERTTLGDLRPGDAVNIETDILARTILHQLDRLRGEAGGLTVSALRAAGLT